MLEFGNVITAMITPFTNEGKVNYAIAEKLAAYLADNGSDSIVVCGTTGESPTLTWEEEYELFKVVKGAVSSKAKVIAGTGSNSTIEAISATQKAAKLGLDGSLQVVPYYNKPPQEGLYQHFAAIANSCESFPLLLYNIPGRTGVNLLPSIVARLALIPNIIGIKEASGNLDQVAEIRSLTSSEFAIYSGDDSLTLPMLSVGSQGVISVASHLVGKSIQNMIKAHQMGQPQVATKIHLELFPLFKVLFCSTNPIPVKAALKLQGWEVGATRPPLSGLSPEQEELIESVLGKITLI